jgi:hypothetical protein
MLQNVTKFDYYLSFNDKNKPSVDNIQDLPRFFREILLSHRSGSGDVFT